MAITAQMRTEVSQLYVALFMRAPDADGLGYWVSAVDGGKTIAKIAQEMYDTPNARPYYPLFMTDAEVVTSFYTNVLGRTPDAEGKAYWVGQLGAAGATKGSVIADMLYSVVNYTGTDPLALASKSLFINKVKVAEYYAEVMNGGAAGAAAAIANVTATSDVSTDAAIAALIAGQAVMLTTAIDNLTGSNANDTFVAYISDNANTLQSNDIINGGLGSDKLTADIGNSQAFAITPQSTSVEYVQLRAQTIDVDATDNNTSLTGEVQIDAQRMQGVTTWESNNSRADLLIEDVRILDNQITKDITIAMVETDPGHVDYGVYFDQLSLRNVTTNTSVLNIKVMDIKAAGLTPTTPLLDSPYDGFSFKLDGVIKTIKSEGIDKAVTYAELLTEVTKALDLAKATDPSLAGFTVTKSGTFTATDADTLIKYTGETIVLTNTGVGKIAMDAGTGFTTANGVVPNNSNLYTNIDLNFASSTDLVTSKIILDDVGRGSTGGDLVVGGLSVGDTSTSQGVQRFEIEVRDNSKLQTINSTNNTLREVTIKNGVTTSADSAYTTTVKNAGNLTVNGSVNNIDGDSTNTGASNGALPGTLNQHDSGFGFSDVRLIDASAMVGKLALTAEITEKSIAKYVNLVDTASNPAADNIKVEYTGGANDDTLVVGISGIAAASRSKIVSGREDFTFAVNGGAGNDAITVGVNFSTGTENWYNNQDLNNNITVLGGAGNDTIRTPGAGDMTIDAGTGNDVVYTDNTGFQVNAVSTAAGAVNATAGRAAWVFNAINQLSTIADPVALDARDLNDLRSDINHSYNLFKATLTVTYKGLPSVTVTVGNTNGTDGYTTSDLEINNAIKAAINTDPTLKSLLVAKDGPANTLIVESLIDGVQTTGDLTVALAAPKTLTLAAQEIAAASAVYLPAGTVASEANVLAAMGVSLAALTAKGDYTTQLATDGAQNLTGADSVTTSDNLVSPGTGDDVIVLGTTVGASRAQSSNEVIKLAGVIGNDVVVNFDVAGNGIDFIDFSALGGSPLVESPLGATTTQKSITVEAFDVTQANAKTLIEGKFAAANTTEQTHIYVGVSAGNVGTVYTIADPIGATNALATMVGTIDLGDTLWTDLTAANFVNAGATDFFLKNGPSDVAAPSYVITPTHTAIDEGSPVTFNLTTLNVAEGTVLPYTLSGTGITIADTTVALTGNVTVAADGTASLVVTPTADVTTEGAETLVMNIMGASSSVTINDTSITSVGPVTTPVAVSAAGSDDANAPVGNHIYTVAMGNYTYSIANFAAGDVIDFPAGSTASVNNGDFADGNVDVTYALGGQTVTIRLTGLGANDALLNSAADINTVFGAGSLI